MPDGPAIITIGNFDGVHRGHQTILQRAREIADAQRAADTRVLAITFDPFPIDVLRPGSGPPHLGSIRQRVEALDAAGADEVLVVEPTPELLGMEAGHFINALIDRHHAVGFVEGEDFRFGKMRGGDMTMLKAMGQTKGFTVEAIGRVESALSDRSVAPISSSLVRWLVGRGRVEDAQACLGRPFELCATVVKGEQRGRTLGVPTVNLDPQAYTRQIVPMDGVYAGHARLGDDDTAIPAAISIGVKPTFGHDRLTVEAHLIDYQADHPDALYGQTVRLAFDRWLRDQYPFPGIETLKQQLGRDIQAAAINA